MRLSWSQLNQVVIVLTSQLENIFSQLNGQLNSIVNYTIAERKNHYYFFTLSQLAAWKLNWLDLWFNRLEERVLWLIV